MIRGSINPRKRISEIRASMAELSRGELDDRAKEEMANLRLELEHLYMDEEIFWRQRGKNQWAKEGDRNTRFFHAKASKRKRNNSISGLFNGVGIWTEDMGEVEGIIQEYFGSLFQSSNPDSAVIDEILEAVVPVVTPEMNLCLNMPFSSV